MTQVKAKLNNLRISPRKVRAVANLVKRKNVIDALNQLEHFVRKPVGPLKKLLNSAIANAENNFSMIRENLYIKNLTVDEGTKLKRFRAKGFGRAAVIQKKTSHISIVLDERTPGLRREKSAVKSKKRDVIESSKEEMGEAESKKPEVKREIGNKKSLLGNFGKRLFQRKAI